MNKLKTCSQELFDHVLVEVYKMNPDYLEFEGEKCSVQLDDINKDSIAKISKLLLIK